MTPAATWSLAAIFKHYTQGFKLFAYRIGTGIIFICLGLVALGDQCFYFLAEISSAPREMGKPLLRILL